MFTDTTFLYWANEREQIRQRREAGLPRSEWTQDPIFIKNRFCNVSREDDAVTRWVAQHIRTPFSEAGDEKQLFLAICIARYFNIIGALQMLVQTGVLDPERQIDLHEVADILHKYKADGGKTFNSAYLVGAPINYRTAAFGSDKIAYVCGILNHATPPAARTRQGYVEELSKQFGFAEFMSGQIAADMAYTFILRDAPDHRTWAPRGPGAQRGMNRALGKPLMRQIPVDEYLAVGRAQMAMLPQDMVEDRRLTLHDVASNVNCETDKYLRGGGTRIFRFNEPVRAPK